MTTETMEQEQVGAAVAPAPLREWPALQVGTTVYLAVDEINADHDGNSRRYAASRIVDMAQSLLENGQMTPVSITSTTRRLGFGYRRRAGIVHINENKLYKAGMWPNLAPNVNGKQILVRCEVIPELSALELYDMNAAENDDREDITPIDKAEQAKRRTDPVEAGGFGQTQKEAAESMSRGGKKFAQSTVSKYLKVLAEAPKWARDLVHKNSGTSKYPMETLIECVSHPAGSKERDTALDAFRAGESGTKVKAKVRETAAESGEGEGEGESSGKATKKVTIRSRAEWIAYLETEAFVEEGGIPTPYTDLHNFYLKFMAGKMSAKKLQNEAALRVKKTLPKTE